MPTFGGDDVLSGPFGLDRRPRHKADVCVIHLPASASSARRSQLCRDERVRVCR